MWVLKERGKSPIFGDKEELMELTVDLSFKYEIDNTLYFAETKEELSSVYIKEVQDPSQFVTAPLTLGEKETPYHWTSGAWYTKRTNKDWKTTFYSSEFVPHVAYGRTAGRSLRNMRRALKAMPLIFWW